MPGLGTGRIVLQTRFLPEMPGQHQTPLPPGGLTILVVPGPQFPSTADQQPGNLLHSHARRRGASLLTPEWPPGPAINPSFLAACPCPHHLPVTPTLLLCLSLA